jgi:hypothetical protein
MQHPLHHLLFIQFLCGTCREFFAELHIFPTPLDNGPWPCLNPFCSHYEERVITSRVVRQATLNRTVATFTCHCGFTYSRSESNTDQDAIFRIGRVVQYGSVWDQRLIAYWADKNISNAQLEILMRKDISTIRRQAARLGLPFAPDIPQRGKRPKIYQDACKERRDKYRILWEEALKTHPNASMKEVVESASKIYHWLCKYDNEWIKEHYPARTLLPKQERFGQAKNQLKYNSYSRLDADFAQLIRETGEEILKRTGFPIQMTRQMLIAKINDISPLRKSNVAYGTLPLTTNALDKMTETHTAFIWRKLKWTVQSFIDEQNFPSYGEFLRRAHISKHTPLRPAIKQLTQIAYNSLSAGTLLYDQEPNLCTKDLKEGVDNVENIDVMTNGSFAAACINIQMRQTYNAKYATRQIYDLVSILLLTVAAVVNGANTCNAVAHWGYQNEELLGRFGVPEGDFPTTSTLMKIYAKLDVNSFEKTLEAWLLKTFPLTQIETSNMLTYIKGIYVPGLRLLRSYRHMASEVVEKLR